MSPLVVIMAYAFKCRYNFRVCCSDNGTDIIEFLNVYVMNNKHNCYCLFTCNHLRVMKFELDHI